MSPAFRAFVSHALARLSRIVGRVLTVSLLAHIHFVVFTPVAIFLRVVRRDPVSSRPDKRRTSYWQPIPQLAGLELHRRQFSMERAGVTRRGLVGSLWLMIMFSCTLVVANTIVGSYLRSSGPPAPIPPPDLPALAASSSWFPQYAAEFKSSVFQGFEPFVAWRRHDFAGTYITIKDGLRQTYKPAELSHRRGIKVGVFGGSTTWGVGSRNEHTWPSELARVAEEAGIVLDVTNYGESGYAEWQEVILLTQVLTGAKLSYQRPDLVIFYDGFNEVWTQLEAEEPIDRPTHFNDDGIDHILRTHNEIVPVLRANSAFHILKERLVGAPSDEAFGGELPKDKPIDFARPAAHQYNAASEAASRLCASYAIPIVHFWQPSSLTRTPLDPGEQRFVEGDFQNFVKQVFRETRLLLRPETIDISNVLDQVQGPLFIDQAHVNETGNRVIATAIFAKIRPALTELAARADISATAGAR
jgi:lysophospholipase L1-like esterase